LVSALKLNLLGNRTSLLDVASADLMVDGARLLKSRLNSYFAWRLPLRHLSGCKLRFFRILQKPAKLNLLRWSALYRDCKVKKHQNRWSKAKKVLQCLKRLHILYICDARLHLLVNCASVKVVVPYLMK
jgi:hypothetical protein